MFMRFSIVGLIVACAAAIELGCERCGKVHGERDPNKSERHAPGLLALHDGDRGY